MGSLFQFAAVKSFLFCMMINCLIRVLKLPKDLKACLLLTEDFGRELDVGFPCLHMTTYLTLLTTVPYTVHTYIGTDGVRAVHPILYILRGTGRNDNTPLTFVVLILA